MAYTTKNHSRWPAAGPHAVAGATDVYDDSPTRCSRLTPDDPHGGDAGNALAADAPAAAAGASPGAAASAAAASPVAEGRLIAGRYQVERRLGGGGMAEVFLARDTTLGRLVAVKVLRERFADDEEFVARFHREARAAAALNHPNVVAIHDRGGSAGSSYIVMEYVPGETLKDRVQRSGRLTPAAARDIELGLLAALRAAHDGGVIHRDVTAQNVLLAQDGRVKVADFGIAHFGSSELTSTGIVMGTSRYLSPEQARGEPTDERSDLYSAGVVLFEMLTGRLPFEGDNDLAIALQHANDPAPSPATFVPDLPPALVAIVGKALRKDPAERFQTAAEFFAALGALDLGAVTSATIVVPAGAAAGPGVGAATAATRVAAPAAALAVPPRRRLPPARRPPRVSCRLPVVPPPLPIGAAGSGRCWPSPSCWPPRSPVSWPIGPTPVAASPCLSWWARRGARPPAICGTRASPCARLVATPTPSRPAPSCRSIRPPACRSKRAHWSVSS